VNGKPSPHLDVFKTTTYGFGQPGQRLKKLGGKAGSAPPTKDNLGPEVVMFGVSIVEPIPPPKWLTEMIETTGGMIQLYVSKLFSKLFSKTRYLMLYSQTNFFL
jgi:hypothetical protein